MFCKSLKCVLCGSEFKLLPIYDCKNCGGSLDATYDYKMAFAASLFTNSDPSMGIWKYKNLLPVNSNQAPVTLGEGGTPLIPADRLAKKFNHSGLYIKNETINPTLSFKDRPLSVGMTVAAQFNFNGVVTASTGNTGVATAAYAARAGLDCSIFVPIGTPKEKLNLMLAFGAKLFEVEGTFSDAYNKASGEAELNGLFNLTSTFLNPYAAEGDKTLAYEIFSQFGGVPDWIVVPIGAGPLLVGCYKGFKELLLAGLVSKLPRMVGVQARNCSPIVRAFESNVASVYPWDKPDAIAGGIADPLTTYPNDGTRTLKAIRDSNGTAIGVDDSSIIESVTLLSTLEGILAEAAAATSISAASWMICNGTVAKEESIICVVTGHGLKDLSKLIK